MPVPQNGQTQLSNSFASSGIVFMRNLGRFSERLSTTCEEPFVDFERSRKLTMKAPERYY